MSRRRSLAALFPLLLAATLACREGTRSERPLGIAIPAEEPGRLVSLPDLVRTDVVRTFDLERPASAASWRSTSWSPTGSSPPRREGPGVLYPSGRLETSLELDSSSVDAVEVTAEGVEGAGFLELSWDGASREGPARGAQVVSARDAGAKGEAVFRFLVRSESGWRGEIRSLTVRVVNPMGTRTVVRSIAFLRVAGLTEGLGPSLERPVRLEVDHEVRSSFLLAGDRELVLPDRLSRAGRLSLGVALPQRTEGRIRLFVRSAASGDGTTVEREIGSVSAPAEVARWFDYGFRIPAPPPGRPWTVLLRSELVSPFPLHAVLGGIRFQPEAAGTDRPPDVLVISVDTLRADRLSLYGHARRTSPNLDSWAAQATMVFEDAVAPAPSTLPSHASLFTGCEVLRHGAFLDVPLRPGLTTIAEMFRRRGYETIAVTGGGYLHPFYGLHRGFDRYRFWPRRPDRNDPDLADGVRRVTELLREGDRGPRLIFLHTYDVHAPYRVREPFLSKWRGQTPPWSVQPLEVQPADGSVSTRVRRWPVLQDPQGVRRQMRPEEAEMVSDIYDSGVARMDAVLAPLLRMLAAPETRSRTIAVLLSDHGESLGEQDRWEHGYLVQTNLRVPLVLQLPGAGQEGTRFADPASLIDVLPTLAEACDLDLPPEASGRSLLGRLRTGEAGRPEDVVSYSGEINEGLAVRRGSLKWVLSDSIFEAAGGARVFDLGRDRDERTPEVPRTIAAGAELDNAGLRRLAETRPGTFLALENREPRPVGVAVEGTALRWNTVKFAGGDRPVAAILPSGRISFELGPGARTRIQVQDRAETGPFELTLRRDDGVEERVRVPPAVEGRTGPSAGQARDVTERILARPSTIAVAVRVWDVGPAPTAGGAGLPGEAERQLKALGYLN